MCTFFDKFKKSKLDFVVFGESRLIKVSTRILCNEAADLYHSFACFCVIWFPLFFRYIVSVCFAEREHSSRYILRRLLRGLKDFLRVLEKIISGKSSKYMPVGGVKVNHQVARASLRRLTSCERTKAITLIFVEKTTLLSGDCFETKISFAIFRNRFREIRNKFRIFSKSVSQNCDINFANFRNKFRCFGN